MVRALAAIALIVLLAPGFSGCLGIGRTEWAFDAVQADALAKRGLTGRGVIVGIVDTGLEKSHPSLDHVNIVAWKDFLNNRADPYDDVGHGTHVAGVVAAKGSWKGWFYGADLRGVAPDVDLVVVKACTSENCDAGAVVNGIDFAVQQRVHVLVLSLGGEQTLINLGPDANAAVKRATDRGVVVVVAAGNCREDPEDPCTDVESPAEAPTAIAVGSLDEELKVSDFSAPGDTRKNYGLGTLPTGLDTAERTDPNKKPELVAPGEGILSAFRDGKYAFATGTSQAAPFVAGVVALLLEANPEYKPDGANGGPAGVEAIKRALAESARDLGARQPHDPLYGYGLVQGDAALGRLA